ncbi:hypothetical protein F0T03_01755 [Yersinia canariae]|uniref:Uncharacterized protein n=1 Tax=Yersinia canariae TaxID=2607663 RepID=A0A857ETV0_9GAMM|nr:hypothetical protein [Yersinia canariae]QHB31047.1 hypothetical protein F0T03_01755 [Yersinia canariae]
MSIDIRCYTKLIVPDLQVKLDQFLLKYPDVFPEHYMLYKARDLGLFDKEISNEFGLDPESYFGLHITNKTLEISADEMANMIRQALGADNVIVLLNGEDLI